MTSHAERILDRVSRGCSLNRVFVSGEDAAALADLLRLRGAIVEESRASTIAEVIDDLRAASTSFSLAIVCISAPDLGDEDARYLCAALRRATSTAYLRITGGHEPGSSGSHWKSAVVGASRSGIRLPPASQCRASRGIRAARLARHYTLATHRSGHRSDPSRRSTSSGRSLPTRTQRSGATRARRISFVGTIVCWTLTVVSAPVPRLSDLQRSLIGCRIRSRSSRSSVRQGALWVRSRRGGIPRRSADGRLAVPGRIHRRRSVVQAVAIHVLDGRRHRRDPAGAEAWWPPDLLRDRRGSRGSPSNRQWPSARARAWAERGTQ